MIDTKKSKSQLLLVLGCQRSGTTLLASLLGGHSEINMLNESTTKDVLKLMGKRYNGNKLLAWREIRLNSRAHKLGHLLNRIVNLHIGKRNSKYHRIRLFPTSVMSIQDFIDMKAKIIVIRRDKQSVVQSIVNRTNMTAKQADSEYDKAIACAQSVSNISLEVDYSDLVSSPVETLKKVCSFLNLKFEERMLEGAAYNNMYPHDHIMSEKALFK